VLSGLVVAVPAVNGLVAARLERDLGLFTAASAGRGIHLARASIRIAATVIAESLGSPA